MNQLAAGKCLVQDKVHEVVFRAILAHFRADYQTWTDGPQPAAC
jgi:hypothetical protein